MNLQTGDVTSIPNPRVDGLSIDVTAGVGIVDGVVVWGRVCSESVVPRDNPPCTPGATVSYKLDAETRDWEALDTSAFDGLIVTSFDELAPTADGAIALASVRSTGHGPTRLIAVLQRGAWRALQPVTGSTLQLCATTQAAYWLESTASGDANGHTEFRLHTTDLASGVTSEVPDVPPVSPNFGGVTVVLGCDAEAAYLTSGEPDGRVSIYRYLSGSWGDARELLPEKGSIATDVISSPVGIAVVWVYLAKGWAPDGSATAFARQAATGHVAKLPATVARAKTLVWDGTAGRLVSVSPPSPSGDSSPEPDEPPPGRSRAQVTEVWK